LKKSIMRGEDTHDDGYERKIFYSNMTTLNLEEKHISQAFTDTLTTALGTVAALTWTDAVRSLFAPGGVLSMSTTWGPWVVAVIATLIAIWGTRLLAKVNKQVEAKFLKKKPPPPPPASGLTLENF
jgi:hypothetical protein